MAQTNEQGKSPSHRVKRVWQTVVGWRPPETVERWLPTITRTAFAIVLLYFCLYILQFVGKAPGIYTPDAPTEKFSSSALELDPDTIALLTSPLTAPEITIRGQTAPNRVVQVVVESRVVQGVRSDSSGSFEFELSEVVLRPWTNSIKLEALDSDDSTTAWSIWPINWSPSAFEPEIRLALYIPEEEMLWVAGTAAPGATVHLENESSDHLADLRANGFGVFEDFLFPVDELPGQVLVRLASSENALPSIPQDVVSTPLEELPLMRVVDINLQRKDEEARLRQDRASFNFQIGLPREHPYFGAIVEGMLPVKRFTELSFGTFRGSAADLLPECPECYGSLSISLGEPEFEFKDQLGIVKVRGAYDGTINGIGFTTFADPLSGYATVQGIGRWPFLSKQDRLTIHYDGFKSDRFRQPYPTESNDELAFWIGPLDFGEQSDFLVVELSPSEEEATTPTSREADPREREKFLDYWRAASSRLKEKRPFLYWTWQAVILALPFLSLFFVRKLEIIDDEASWKWFIGMAIVLGVWRGWNYFYYVLLIGPGKWARDAVNLFLRWMHFGVEGYGSIPIIDAGNTFWLLFVPLVVLVPLSLKYRGNDKPGENKALSWGKRVWLIIRWSWAVLLIIAIRHLYIHWAGMPGGVLQKIEGPEGFYLVGIALESLLAILLATLCTLFLLSTNLRGALFGLGFVAVTVRGAAQLGVIEFLCEHFYKQWFDTVLSTSMQLDAAVQQMPWSWVQVSTGIGGVLFVAWLLGRIFPNLGKQSWVRWVTAIVVVVVSMRLDRIPTTWLLATSAFLVVLAAGWFVLQAILRLGNSDSSRWPSYVAWIILSLLIAWPVAQPDTAHRFRDLFSLVDILDSRLVQVLALFLFVLLWQSTTQMRGMFHKPAALAAAGYIFAAIVINNYDTVMLVPLVFLVAWLIGTRCIFRHDVEMEELCDLIGDKSAMASSLIQSSVRSALLQRRLTIYKNALRKKIEKGNETPDNYQKCIGEYEEILKGEYQVQEQASQPEGSKHAFSVGHGDLQNNLRAAIQIGLLLSLIPMGITAYRYLPSISVRYPFPLTYLASFLIWALAKWVLYAFFFGYYYPHLRGDTGLAKGLWMSLWVILPQLSWHLVTFHTLEDMRNLLLEGSQVFIFFSVLGLLMDIRVLRANGFRSRDIVTVHNLPRLAVFSSSILTALAPILSGILTGWLGSAVEKLPEVLGLLGSFTGE